VIVTVVLDADTDADCEGRTGLLEPWLDWPVPDEQPAAATTTPATTKAMRG
jgi:hypothetical protein